jgi:hypothetical protein
MDDLPAPPARSFERNMRTQNRCERTIALTLMGSVPAETFRQVTRSGPVHRRAGTTCPADAAAYGVLLRTARSGISDPRNIAAARACMIKTGSKGEHRAGERGTDRPGACCGRPLSPHSHSHDADRHRSQHGSRRGTPSIALTVSSSRSTRCMW